MTRLTQLIEDYLHEHSLSRRDLAKRMEIQHRTLNVYLNSDKSPTLYFLIKLGRAINMDLLTLVAQAEPEAVKPINADVMRLAERINNLPGAYREVVVTMIMNIPLKSGNNVGNETKVSGGEKRK